MTEVQFRYILPIDAAVLTCSAGWRLHDEQGFKVSTIARDLLYGRLAPPSTWVRVRLEGRQ